MKSLMRKLVSAGTLGLAPKLFAKDKEEEKKKKAAAGDTTPATTTPATTMKKGGYVKAADGCAKKGKTKGRMV